MLPGVKWPTNSVTVATVATSEQILGGGVHHALLKKRLPGAASQLRAPNL